MTAILHAGDIGNSDVIRQLERIAPVVAVSGNVDEFEQRGFPRVCAVAGSGGTIAYDIDAYVKLIQKSVRVLLATLGSPDVK